jgi:hypothetical protein
MGTFRKSKLGLGGCVLGMRRGDLKGGNLFFSNLKQAAFLQYGKRLGKRLEGFDFYGNADSF